MKRGRKECCLFVFEGNLNVRGEEEGFLKVVPMAPQPDAVGPDRRQQCITPEGQAERCRVLLRFRPPPAMDLGKGVDAPGTPFEVQGETVTVRPRDAGGVEDVSFTFDKVFPDSATQDDVFQSVMHDSVTSVLTVCASVPHGQSTEYKETGRVGVRAQSA